MKTPIIAILISTALLAYADDKVCVNVAKADEARLTEAFGSILGLRDADGNPRPATIDEISNATGQWLGQSTHDYERRKNMTTFTPPPFTEGSGKMNPPPPAPTPSPAYTPTKPAPSPKKKK